MNKKSVLVVGAGGFIGGFIVKQGLERGYDVYAAVRASTSRKYLADSNIHFVNVDYSSYDSIVESLRAALPAEGKWNYIIYNLGATKCAKFNDFNTINYLYLRDFVDALHALEAVPERFLFMSSLSALGAYGEDNGAPADASTVPMPNTRYGLSKIKAETYLQTCSWLPWIIFRPTGVYGPHEQDYLMMIKSIDRHFDFGIGFKEQKLTFIYVDDLVNAMYDAIASEATVHHKYIISEPRAYTQREFRKMVAKALGVRFVIPVKLPLWAGAVASWVSEKVAAFSGKAATLNSDKFTIMRQRNWTCSVEDAVRDFGFRCEYPLPRGLDITVKEYLRSK